MAKAHLQLLQNQAGPLRIWKSDDATYRVTPPDMCMTGEVISPQELWLHGLKGEMSPELATAVKDECKRLGIKYVLYERIKNGTPREVRLRIR